MKFIDEANIEVIAGEGGSGIVSFRREKFVPRGGPDGGNGGKGGNVFAVADYNVNTLAEFSQRHLYHAKNGKNGGSSKKSGASAPDFVLHVPVGTAVYDNSSKVLLHDLKYHGQKVELASGGKGGLGNLNFKSSTNRSPRQCTPGKKGERKKLRLELRVLADVGLLGMPNAGKSTLISRISNARPKISSYPFTTLYPNLGVVNTSLSRRFTIADMPGIIKGAAQGSGLGHLFLRHLTRARVLLHVVDASSLCNNTNLMPILHDIDTVVKELYNYNEKVLATPRWIVLNKLDNTPEIETVRKHFCKKLGWHGPTFCISALTGEGMSALVSALQNFIDEEFNGKDVTSIHCSDKDPRFDKY